MKQLTTLSQIAFEPPAGINTDVPTQVTIEGLIRIFFGVFTAVAVLVIVIAALQFALSRGNPDKQSKARNAIIYAAIGLVISVLAQAIVSFIVDITR